MAEKQALRAAVGAARRAMPAGQRDAARLAIRRAVLQRCRDLGLPAGSRIAAYQPLRTEPGSVELLAELHAAGYQVIVPYLLPDRDLDWLPWRPAGGADPTQVVRSPAEGAGTASAAGTPADALGPAGSRPADALGPAGGRPAETGGPAAGWPAEVGPTAVTPTETLGPAAIGTAALVLVPALAVDRAGHRLGRGGGSYDRALTRVPASTVVAALLFSGELLDGVPTDPWDRPVTALVSPAGWLDLAGTGRGNA